MAERWHFKDTRKVRRSIAVMVETGKRHSDWIREQEENDQKVTSDEETSEAVEEGDKERKRNLIFWVWCDPEVLTERLNNRIGKMIDVSDELLKLGNEQTQSSLTVVLTISLVSPNSEDFWTRF